MVILAIPFQRALIALLIVATCLLPGCGREGAASNASLPDADTARGAPQGQQTQPSQAGHESSPSLSLGLDVDRISREATWASGSLREHFQKHGREGPFASAEAYDASARETIRLGTAFRYIDRSTNARRYGFYHGPTNRFTSLTDDTRRITTHFKPDSGERYVRGLTQSTYP